MTRFGLCPVSKIGQVAIRSTMKVLYKYCKAISIGSLDSMSNLMVMKLTAMKMIQFTSKNHIIPSTVSLSKYWGQMAKMGVDNTSYQKTKFIYKM